MRPRIDVPKALMVLGLSLSSLMLMGFGSPSCVMPGLDVNAKLELKDAGVDKYLGEFQAVESEFGVWTKHTFDPQYDQTGTPNGPVCIAGTEYSVFTKEGDPNKVLIFLQGGGACWQDFYNCQPVAVTVDLGGGIVIPGQEPPESGVGPGVFDPTDPDNPFADYSIVYMPYCDGSVFGGDNDVEDSQWNGAPETNTFPLAGQQRRFHHGIRNVSAGMDVARATFPHANRITVAGSSAGGVGAAAFTPFLARFLYGDFVKLTVFNDAGPIAVNLADTASVAARAADWQFDQFYPASCSECSAEGQQTAIVDWRLENDSTIREAFYETDADATNRFFTSIPTQSMYRDLVVTEHGVLNAAYPDRYKTFIVSGDCSHTALQSPLFYNQGANGVLLNDWTQGFLANSPVWVDIVEDFVPAPQPPCP